MANILRRKILRGAGMAAAALTSAPRVVLAAENDFPSKPIRIIVPYGPGGIGDFTARALARYLGEAWNARIIVENKPGASGLVAMNWMRSVPADGYTAVMTSNTTVSAVRHLFKNVAYDPMRDFSHVGMIGVFGSVALAPLEAPFESIPELVEYSRRNPEKVFYGYTNASSQVPSEMLNAYAGIHMQGVPYKETGQAATDLIAGQTQFMFMDYVAAYPLVKGGKVRALAVSQREPAPLWPKLPVMATFYPGFEFSGYITLSLPSGAPANIMEKFNSATRKAITDPNFRNLLTSNGLVPQDDDLTRLDDFISAENRKWDEYARVAQLVPQ